VSIVAVVVTEEQKQTRHGAVLTDDGVDGGHGDCPLWRLNVLTPGGGYATLTYQWTPDYGRVAEEASVKVRNCGRHDTERELRDFTQLGRQAMTGSGAIVRARWLG